MAIDVEQLVQDMVKGAAVVLAAKSPEIRCFAESEFRKLAEELARIEARKAAGTIGEDEAQLLLDALRDAMKTAFVAAKGLGMIAVERAINGALAAIREPVQRALGWALV